MKLMRTCISNQLTSRTNHSKVMINKITLNMNKQIYLMRSHNIKSMRRMKLLRMRKINKSMIIITQKQSKEVLNRLKQSKDFGKTGKKVSLNSSCGKRTESNTT